MQNPIHDRKLILAEALKNAISEYSLKKQDMEKVLGVSKTQLQRIEKNGVDEGSKTGELVLYFLRVIRGISAITGDDTSKANHWLTSKNKAFCGMTPMQRMMSIEGLIDVLRYCDAFRAKL